MVRLYADVVTKTIKSWSYLYSLHLVAAGLSGVSKLELSSSSSKPKQNLLGFLKYLLSKLFDTIKISKYIWASCRPMTSVDTRPTYVQLRPQTVRWPECHLFCWRLASGSRTSPVLSSYYWFPPLKGQQKKKIKGRCQRWRRERDTLPQEDRAIFKQSAWVFHSTVRGRGSR